MICSLKTGALFFSVLAMLAAGASASFVHAQDVSNTTIASPISISGTVEDGDIVSYDARTGLYRRAGVYSDETMFGVVVGDPVLYMTEGIASSTSYPVIRAGEATVNVSTVGGEIQPGDLITTSGLAGRGQRADRDTVSYVLGFALEPMTTDTTIPTLAVSGVEVRFGRVPVALRIGPHLPDNFDTTRSSTTAAALADQPADTGTGSFDMLTAFRYFLGALIAIAAVFVSLRRFGDMFAQSVVSVGRNPLARSQIRSLLAWNALLILVVSGVGLGIGAAIILLP
jgi:hypothetical protein